MDNRTSRLADGVWRLEVRTWVSAYLLANNGVSDADGLTLVDTGTAGCGPSLVRSIRLAGLDPLAVQDVYLTHWHRDHAGSAARLAASSAAPAVHAGAADAAVVRGEVPRPYAVAAPGDVSRLGRLLTPFMRPAAPVRDVRALQAGAQRDIAGGLRVLATPGHTPGHVSLHLPAAGVLLAGDAVFNLLRLTRGPALARSARSHEAATLRQLAALDVEVLAPGHGPPLRGRVAEKLARLAERAAR